MRFSACRIHSKPFRMNCLNVGIILLAFQMKNSCLHFGENLIHHLTTLTIVHEKKNSGRNKNIIFPDCKVQNLIINSVGNLLNITLLICLQNSGTTLSGDVINVQSTFGVRIVAHDEEEKRRK